MTLQLPESFKLTRHSPSMKELEFIYDELKKVVPQNCNILEFGAGPTTWVINQTLNPSKYVVVEDHVPSLKTLTAHMADLEVVKTTWYDIPEDIKYDLVFVDSSAGYPPGVTGLHRHEAVKYSERLLKPNSIMMLHDWHGRSGRQARKYIESTGNYELVASLEDKVGVGIYAHK